MSVGQFGGMLDDPTRTFVTGLGCRECQFGISIEEYDKAPTASCSECFGPLEVKYDYPAIAKVISRKAIARRPGTMWRYGELLPVPYDARVDLATGGTPLQRAHRLENELSFKGEIWIKNDARNETDSFKARVVSVSLTKAKQMGLTTVACSSTGNLANAVAGYGAHAGLRAIVLVPEGLESAKILFPTLAGAHVVVVEGSYDKVNRLCQEIAGEHGDIGIVNGNLRAFYSDGSRTLAFEVAEQLLWSPPDHVVVPVASGSLLTKIHKGFGELHKVGLLDEAPEVRVTGAQAEGCSPVASAFLAEDRDYRPVQYPDTIAKSLAIGNPADGNYALDIVRQTGGGFGRVSDSDVRAGIGLLARTEGIWGETAAGVTIATLAHKIADGTIRPGERVVAYITGHGAKTPDPFNDGSVQRGSTSHIKPRLEEFEELLATLPERGPTVELTNGGRGACKSLEPMAPV